MKKKTIKNMKKVILSDIDTIQFTKQTKRKRKCKFEKCGLLFIIKHKGQKYCDCRCKSLAREMTKKNCAYCKKEFLPKNANRKFCSYECSIKLRKKRGTQRKCGFCEEVIYVRPGLKSKNTYCTHKCWSNSKKNRIELTCENCNKKYLKQISQIKWRGKSRFCSNECRLYGRSNIEPTKLGNDKLWSDLIKKNAGFKCEYCGNESRLNSHHIFSRRNYAVRWYDKNGICLCVSHHILGNFSAHKAPIEFVEWMKEKRGIIWYNDLRIQAAKTVKTDLKEMHDVLQKELEKYE